MDEQEHEVYGGEIPGDDVDMEADFDGMSSRHEEDQGYDEQSSKAPSPFHFVDCFLGFLNLPWIYY